MHWSRTFAILFQSRNREAYNFKRNSQEVTMAQQLQFQSRNREAYNFKSLKGENHPNFGKKVSIS